MANVACRQQSPACTSSPLDYEVTPVFLKIQFCQQSFASTCTKKENKETIGIHYNIILEHNIKQAAGSHLFSPKLETLSVNCNNVTLQFKTIQEATQAQVDTGNECQHTLLHFLAIAESTNRWQHLPSYNNQTNKTDTCLNSPSTLLAFCQGFTDDCQVLLSIANSRQKKITGFSGLFEASNLARDAVIRVRQSKPRLTFIHATSKISVLKS